MTIATVSEKGRVVIPKDSRQRYGIEKGHGVHIGEVGGRIVVIPVAADPIAAGLGMLRGGPSLTEALLNDRRWELEREERDLPPPRSQ